MKTYIVAATIVAVVGLILGTYRAGYIQGKIRVRARYEQAALAHRDRENSLLLQLETAKKERKIVYRERIEAVRGTDGACLDRPVPEPIARFLHDAHRAETRSAADP